ncbi:hypothetical protein DMB38_20185 [Streptomyces sp. WAC 06738]|nr:hypothetical protein DMB38_20185 [Streptomyces sp. WAC 06738]
MAEPKLLTGAGVFTVIVPVFGGHAVFPLGHQPDHTCGLAPTVRSTAAISFWRSLTWAAQIVSTLSVFGVKLRTDMG